MHATQSHAGLIASQLIILILNIFKMTYLNVIRSYTLLPPTDTTDKGFLAGGEGVGGRITLNFPIQFNSFP